MTTYGDFFLKLDIADEIGIVNARPFSSYEIERWEEYDEDDDSDNQEWD